MKERFHVLIVDDDHALCRSLSGTLTDAGYRVECLSGAEKPHRAVREIAPDLVILDVAPPGEGGLEALRGIQLHRATREIPLIVTSRHASLEYELLDVFDFLPKPLDERRLLEDVALAARRGKAERTPFPPLQDGELTLFQDYLHHHSGLHFDRGNVRLLERGLMRRMRALNLESYRQYHDYLARFAESRRELAKLLSLLTVGETYFFRFLPQFQALVRSVFPDLIARLGGKRPLRIWSAGCSTGEEPYSLAMLLAQHFPRVAEGGMEILATDINKKALDKAREGLYGPRALRVTDPVYRERYFRRVGGSFQINDEIRRMVRFAYLNLQTGDYPSPAEGTADVDLLFCRNVMIYFRPETVRRIIERFSRCLVPGGYLFLGHSETLSQISGSFSRLSQAGGFYYRLKTEEEAHAGEAEPLPAFVPEAPLPEALPAPPPPPAVLLPAEPPPPPAGQETQALFFRGMEAFMAEEFDRASAIFDRILEGEPGHVGALLGRGFVLANRGLYEESLACCETALAGDDLRPEGYFLRGIVLETRGEWEEAMREYRKALLLDMDFVMPHFNLSRLHRRRGETREARRELRNCVNLLERIPRETLIPYSGGLSREVFLEVCRADLERQEKSP